MKRSYPLAALAQALIALLAVSLTAAPATDAGEGALEEFAGPFPSWKDVRRDYGAIGDGTVDDTSAIQHGLDDLRRHESSCVLWFPAGTYRVSRTLSTRREAHTDCMGIALLGENPATTAIAWDGPSGGTILKYDAWYSRISRLTLDGRGKAAVALAWGDAFSTYDETSDMAFRDCGTGLKLATADAGQAENLVLRSSFLRCGTGIDTVNFNSLDIWALSCRFEDCGHGLYNHAGNFHAYGCLFLRSRTADIGTANLMVFSFVGNTSIGSARFIDFSGGHTWGSPTTIARNRVIDPREDRPIRLSNGGPYLLLDNEIRTRPGSGPAVELTWGDQVLLGNVYTSPEPVKEAGRFRRIDERVVPPEAINGSPPHLPPTPRRTERETIEVRRGAGDGEVQAAIDRAAGLPGKQPVVHLPMGVYPIAHTLVVPPGSDLELAGDGAAETATVLRWTGPPGGPLLRLEGPPRAALRDLHIAAPGATAVVAEGCDAPGGRVLADELNVSGGAGGEKARAGVLVDGVEEADVLLRCLQGGSSCGTWVEVAGGPRRAAGGDAPGKVTVVTGATGTAGLQYDVIRGGRLVVRGVYHEMSAPEPRAIRLRDRGSLAIDATRFSYKTAAETPLIDLDGFRGDFTLASSLLLPVDSTRTAQVRVAAPARALVMGNLFWVNETGVDADRVWRPEGAARAAFLGCNVNSGTAGATRNGFGFLDPRGEADDGLIREMVEPLRRAPFEPSPAVPPPGAADLRIRRLLIAAGKDGVGLELRR